MKKFVLALLVLALVALAAAPAMAIDRPIIPPSSTWTYR